MSESPTTGKLSKHPRSSAILSSLLFSLIVGALFLVIMLLSTWVTFRRELWANFDQFQTYNSLDSAVRSVHEYKIMQGEHPKSLDQVAEELYGGEILRDSWGNPIQCKIEGEEIEVWSYGKDGQPGGKGLNADIYLDLRHRELMYPTFVQFYEQNSRMLNFGCFFSFLFTITTLSFLIQQRRPQDTLKREFKVSLILIQIVVITCFALFVGLTLLPLHIPNGH